MTGRAEVPPDLEGGYGEAEEADRAFFGRRKGKRLRGAQEDRLESLLPTLRIDLPPGGGRIEPRRLFSQMGTGPEEIWLEIGFGGGEHLAARAAAHPQRKRRFVSDESLAQISRLLKDGGTFRFASDIDDYAGWTLARVARSPDLHWTAASARDWLTPFPGWPGTRYEAKALATGRRPTYLEFVRRPR